MLVTIQDLLFQKTRCVREPKGEKEVFFKGICILEMLLKHQKKIQVVIVDSGSSSDQ